MTQEQFDKYMAALDAIMDDAQDRLSIASFELTEKEKAALSKAPPELMERVNDALSRYTAVGPDQRPKLVKKALASMLLVAPELKRAMDLGYAQGRKK